MDINSSNVVGGSLQISTDVIAKIAKLATLEVEGVREVRAGTPGVKELLGKMSFPRAVAVQLLDDVAELTVSIVVGYGVRIPAVCEKVQENVKSAVQNMTSITVSKVNVAVTGVLVEQPEAAEEE